MVLDSALGFVERYKPHYRLHLGDLIDTAAFRAGAHGTSDEVRPIAPDFNAGVDLIKRYRPTHITWGNHDVRLLKLAQHPGAIVSHAAATLWNELVATAEEVGAKTRPYTVQQNHFKIGAHLWTHGFNWGIHALQQHVNWMQSPVVMSHIHAGQELTPPTLSGISSFAVGTLMDIRRAEYALQRPATLRWNHAIVGGEVCETKTGGQSRLWLVKSAPGEPLQFPM